MGGRAENPPGVAQLTDLNPCGLLPSSLRLVCQSEAILEGRSESRVCLLLHDLLCPELLRRLPLFQTSPGPRFPIVCFPGVEAFPMWEPHDWRPARARGSVFGETPQLLALWLLWPWRSPGCGVVKLIDYKEWA